MNEKITQKLEYNVPIQQSISSNNSKKFLISGIAINSVLTRNGVKFEKDELMKSAPSLRKKPLLKDHDNSIDSIVGQTTENVFFDEGCGAIRFEAEVIDEACKKKIQAGLISSVSVGCTAMLETEDDCVIARGIDFMELSLVAVPADPNAGIQTAIECAMKLKEKEKITVVEQKQEIVQEIIEQKIEEKIEVKNMEEKKEVIEQKIIVQEKVEDKSSEIKAMAEEISLLKEKLSKLESKKEESKGIVLSEKSTDMDNYVLGREGGAYAFSVKNYTQDRFKRV